MRSLSGLTAHTKITRHGDRECPAIFLEVSETRDFTGLFRTVGYPHDCVTTNPEGLWSDVSCTAYYEGICEKVAKYSFCAIEEEERRNCASPDLGS